MIISNLKYPPIKNKNIKELPKVLIYHQSRIYYDKFILFPTDKTGLKKRVIMECTKEFINRDGRKNIPSLYIDNLISNCSGNGLGTKMLDFAKSYSKKVGCNGYFHLLADGCYNPHRLPHIFYRKYGMSTTNYKIDKKLDKLIKKGKNATYKDFKTEEMFYPPIKHPESKFKQFISRFFK